MNKNLPFTLCFLLLLILLCLQTSWATAPLDFDGDGKTDPAVIRIENKRIVWYILGSTDGYKAFQWGAHSSTSEDRRVPADYDGDGKCDIAVYRRTFSQQATTFQSYWWIFYSGSNTYDGIPWGQSLDYEMPQDYDGDGKADIAVYRPSETMWYMLQSRDGFRAQLWGPGMPINGDYDADGKADYALYSSGGPNPAPMTFKIKRSSDGNSIVEQLGNGWADFAAPGDYDGDGKTDIAVWGGRCEFGSNIWRWHRSSDGKYDQLRWGLGCTDDEAVQGDYDGDGTTDIAVFRHGNALSPQSIFYINGSTNGFTAIQWGHLSDGGIGQIK